MYDILVDKKEYGFFITSVVLLMLFLFPGAAIESFKIRALGGLRG